MNFLKAYDIIFSSFKFFPSHFLSRIPLHHVNTKTLSFIKLKFSPKIQIRNFIIPELLIFRSSESNNETWLFLLKRMQKIEYSLRIAS